MLRLITVALREDAVTCLGDLVEAVKCRCAQARIAYGRGEVIHAAIARMERDGRLSFPARRSATPAPRRESRPLSPAEARTVLAELGGQGLLKTVPPERGHVR